jgi:hypothetical protein
MSPEDAGTVGQLAAYAALGAVGVYGAWKAKKAEKYAKPTGNGFAKKVTDTLARIETKVDRTEEKIDHHIESHADAEVANRAARGRRLLRDVNEL